ncbi:unnamed protein product [Ectocarpus sp. CCAP 1310/34]|nr:unnamed protein product [Ectocarpus sp. CCAP 1310/34]
MPPHKMVLDAVRLACVFSLLVVGSDTLYARSEPGEPPEYCTVFHHMVKSAGSTVKSLLHSGTRKEGLPRPGSGSRKDASAHWEMRYSPEGRRLTWLQCGKYPTGDTFLSVLKPSQQIFQY